MKKIVTMLAVIALLLTQVQAFAFGSQTISETVCAFDASNSYAVDRYASTISQISTLTGRRDFNIKNTSAAKRAVYLQFNLTPETIENLKKASKISLRVGSNMSKGTVVYQANSVSKWGTGSDVGSWEVGTLLDSKEVTLASTASHVILFDVTDAIKNINDDDTYIRFAVNTAVTTTTNVYGFGGYEDDSYNNTYYQPKLIAEYSTQPAEFYGRNYSKINSTERLYVDLLNDNVAAGMDIFTQDHATKNEFDYDTVMLVRYKIDNIQSVDRISFTTLLWSEKPVSSRAQLFLADNSWKSSDTSFASIKNGSQTELFTSQTFNGNYAKSGSYWIIPFTLNSAQVEQVKAAADTDGYFTIMVRAINDTPNREDIHGAASGYTTNVSNNDKAFAETEVIKSFSEISSGDELVTERFVVEGSTDATINAVPIIAIYDGDVLKDVEFGETVTLNGTGQTVSASVSVPEDITSPKATLFLWSSLDTLVPVLDSNSIE